MNYKHTLTVNNSGLYVEGRFFGNHFGWAKAFALGLAEEYNRLVEVLDVSPVASPRAIVVFNATPFAPELAVAA